MITGSAGYYSRDLTEKMMTGEDCERRLGSADVQLPTWCCSDSSIGLAGPHLKS